MRIVIAALTACLLAGEANAQQTAPPPPYASSSSSGVLQKIGEAVFSAVEKKAIEEFFGHSATPTERVIIDTARTVIRSATGQPSPQSAGQTSQVEKDDDDDSSWKKKKHKHKNKGRGKSKGRGKQKGLPPGLARRGELPPGLQKRAAKYGSLPPGSAKRELPTDLAAKLPPPTPGTERMVAGSDVVLIDRATNVVLDVLYDVVAGATR